MEKKEKSTLQKAWVESAKEDMKTAKGLYKIKRYSGCLFFCQLAIEKALKAVFIEKNNTYPPYTHKLAKLAKDSNIILSKGQLDHLNEITSFNVEARYDILKERLHKKATKEFTIQYLHVCNELFDYFNKLI